MDTLGLLLTISKQKTKSDYLKVITDQLNFYLAELRGHGYSLHPTKEFIPPQNINLSDVMDIYNLNLLQYIYNGLTSNNWNNFPNDAEPLYYIGISGFVTKQFATLS